MRIASRGAAAAALFVVLLGHPGLARATTAVAQVLGDARAVATAPARWHGRAWALVGLTLAGGAVVYQGDGRVRRFLRERRGPLGNDFADVGTALGDLGVEAPLLLGAALVGWSRDDSTLRSAGLVGLEAAVMAGAATVAIKVTAGRARPQAERGPHDWSGPRTGPSERLSFPSGHTTTAFAAASVLARSYPGGVVPWLAYGGAALTAFARMEQDQHWASDVYGGAAIGLWVGHTLAARHRPRGGPELSLLPLRGGAGAVVTWR